MFITCDSFFFITIIISRYKDDVYDRLWSPFQTDIWKPLNTSLKNDTSISKNGYGVPFAVINTAYTRNRSTGYMGIYWSFTNSNFKFFFYMHFAELAKIKKNQSRVFNIYINGRLWYGPFSPPYLRESTIYSTTAMKTDSEGKMTIWFNKTRNSTLPPLVNAMEIYILKEFLDQETNQTDGNYF